MGCYDQAAVRALGPNELRPKRSSGGKDNNRTAVAVLLFAAKHSGKCNDRGPATHLTKSLKPNALLRHWKLKYRGVAFGLAPAR